MTEQEITQTTQTAKKLNGKKKLIIKIVTILIIVAVAAVSGYFFGKEIIVNMM